MIETKQKLTTKVGSWYSGGMATKRRPAAAITPAAADDDGLRPATAAELAESYELRKLDAIRSDPVLEDLGRLLVRQRGAEAQVAAAVERARMLGLSWHMIGLVAGLTPEGARKRWGAAIAGGGAS